MYLREELTNEQAQLLEQVLPHFDAAIAHKPLKDAIGVAGHLYEVVLMCYIQAMIAEGGKSAGEMASFVHNLNENLTTSLVNWSRQKGKENGKNSTNLIQVVSDI